MKYTVEIKEDRVIVYRNGKFYYDVMINVPKKTVKNLTQPNILCYNDNRGVTRLHR